VAVDGRAVQALLSALCHGSVAVERWDRIEPWTVARAHVAGLGDSRTVIVKWLRSEGARSDHWRLENELAALRFLADDLGSALAPRIIGADLSAGFLVVEDLAPRVALDQLICRDGAEAHRQRLAAFAVVLGELGAATAGHAEKFRAPMAGDPGDPARYATLWSQAHRDAVALGVPIPGPAASDLTAALDELESPGPFLAFGNGDAEANNCLVRESGPADARLIDFEAAGYGHALLDAVCLHVPGPRWLTVGEPVAVGGSTAVDGLADQHRRALAQGVPEAQDDRLYGFGLATACASWALLRLQRFATLDERPPGDHSRLQLVETLESAARTATVHRSLPALSGWLRSVAATLRTRWPDTDLDLTDPVLLPPYTPRG
jgi:aminoglycoside phosphotransferase (APT) family kinase protein